MCVCGLSPKQNSSRARSLTSEPDNCRRPSKPPETGEPSWGDTRAASVQQSKQTPLPIGRYAAAAFSSSFGHLLTHFQHARPSPLRNGVTAAAAERQACQKVGAEREGEREERDAEDDDEIDKVPEGAQAERDGRSARRLFRLAASCARQLPLLYRPPLFPPRCFSVFFVQNCAPSLARCKSNCNSPREAQNSALFHFISSGCQFGQVEQEDCIPKEVSWQMDTRGEAGEGAPAEGREKCAAPRQLRARPNNKAGHSMVALRPLVVARSVGRLSSCSDRRRRRRSALWRSLDTRAPTLGRDQSFEAGAPNARN